MTVQVRERILYKGEEFGMATEPLNQYLETRNDIRLVFPSSACWRGYYGSWEIIDNKLFLIDLNAYIKGYEEVGLNYIFPNQEKVFANWFSGQIRIEDGELLKGYDLKYEKNILLEFEDGVLVSEKEIDYTNKLRKRQWKNASHILKEAKRQYNEDKISRIVIYHDALHKYLKLQNIVSIRSLDIDLNNHSYIFIDEPIDLVVYRKKLTKILKGTGSFDFFIFYKRLRTSDKILLTNLINDFKNQYPNLSNSNPEIDPTVTKYKRLLKQFNELSVDKYDEDYSCFEQVDKKFAKHFYDKLYFYDKKYNPKESFLIRDIKRKHEKLIRDIKCNYKKLKINVKFKYEIFVRIYVRYFVIYVKYVVLKMKVPPEMLLPPSDDVHIVV